MLADAAAGFIVTVCSYFWMRHIVEAHNHHVTDAEHVEPGYAAAMTSLFPSVAAPYFFYRMKGLAGVLEGLLFFLGMVFNTFFLGALLRLIAD